MTFDALKEWSTLIGGACSLIAAVFMFFWRRDQAARERAEDAEARAGSAKDAQHKAEDSVLLARLESFGVRCDDRERLVDERYREMVRRFDRGDKELSRLGSAVTVIAARLGLNAGDFR